jgi:hypothetical protein
MKNLLKSMSIAALLSAFALSLHAQDTQIKPCVMQTHYITINPTVRVNLDSLLKIWKERVMEPNPYFTSTKIIMHWWGHDSRQVIFLYELKNWSDIETAFNKRNEILKAHKGWASDDDFKEFVKMWRSVFAGDHSDEIYQVVAE